MRKQHWLKRMRARGNRQ